MRRAPRPCLPAAGGEPQCVAALLHGARCCPDALCALCARHREALRSRDARLSEDDALFLAEQAIEQLPAECPVCGFPPPPPPTTLGEAVWLPRTSDRGRFSRDCSTCGRPLPPGRQRYCTDRCWREHVRGTEMVGDAIATPAAPRAFRMGRK